MILKYEIGVKKGIYTGIKKGEEHLRDRYKAFSRSVTKNIRKAKRDYEVQVAREVKANTKGFFQLYKTKTRGKTGPVRTEKGDLLMVMTK